MNKHITIHSSDPAAFYFGRWQVDGIRRFTVSAYSRCFFQFAGNAVRFQARTGPAQGICEVWLDGEFQALADCYAPEPGEAWVFEKAGLAGEKIHHLTVIAKPEQNAKARGNGFEPLAFAAPQPVDYPAELRRRMEKEYGLITAGQKGWKDPAEWRPVPYRAEMPRRGVSLLPGMVRQTFDANIKNLKRCASLPGFCEGKPMEWLGEGWQGPGWSSWLPASNEGRMLAGAAGVLRWEEDPELRAIVDGIIAGIKGRMREDGYFNYYPEELSYGKDHSLA
ncbi:MAG: hypothetical protein LBG76_08390, partial [Treponema sp.]|nr:hypothetical protein [Treponema sp.]